MFQTKKNYKLKTTQEIQFKKQQLETDNWNIEKLNFDMKWIYKTAP